MIYPAVYLGLAITALLAGRRSEQVLLVLALLLLLVFMGTRYYVGCDFHGYLVRFENTPPDASVWQAFALNEPLFQALTLWVVGAGLDYMWLNLTATMIIVAGWWRFLKVQDNPMVILALMFPIIGLQLSMSGLRQAIAVALLMVATVHWVRGQRLWTAVWILLGAQFHTSMYAFLPMSFLAGRQISTLRLALSVALLMPVAGFLLQDRLNVYIDRYVTQIYGETSSGGAYVRYALNLLPVPFFLAVRDTVRARFPRRYELLKLFAVIILVLAPVGLWSSIALHRLNYYVMPFSILIFTTTAEAMFRPAQKRLAFVLPLLAYGGYMGFWLSASRHARECYIPYDSYLF